MAGDALNLVELPESLKHGFAQLFTEAMAKPGQAVPIPEQLMVEWRLATAPLDAALFDQLMEIRRTERRGWEAANRLAFGAVAHGAGFFADQVLEEGVGFAVDACADGALAAAGCVAGAILG